MVKIIPAIFEDGWEEFEEKFDKVKSEVNRVQIDVGDGKLIDRETVKPEELSRLNTAVKVDAHLMVEEPVEWLSRCVEGGVSRVFGQIEKMADVAEFIAQAEVKGFEVGLALDLDTDVEEIKEYIWAIDRLLLMAVPMGKSGQEFEEKVLEKIRKVERLRDDLVVVVDGGVNRERIKQCLTVRWAEELEEGTDIHPGFLEMEFAVGSVIWEAEEVGEVINNLQHLK